MSQAIPKYTNSSQDSESLVGCKKSAFQLISAMRTRAHASGLRERNEGAFREKFSFVADQSSASCCGGHNQAAQKANRNSNFMPTALPIKHTGFFMRAPLLLPRTPIQLQFFKSAKRRILLRPDLLISKTSGRQSNRHRYCFKQSASIRVFARKRFAARDKHDC